MSQSSVQQKHELSFAPVEPEGQGRGRTFAYDDAQWKELYKAASASNGTDRKELCDTYHVGYQTLQKKAGVSSSGPSRTTKKRSARVPRQMSVFEQIEALSEGVDSLLEELEEEQNELKERIDEIEKKKELLKKIADLKLGD